MRRNTIALLTCEDETTKDTEGHRETVVSALENRCGVDASPWVRIPHPPLTCTNARTGAAAESRASCGPPK